MQVFNNFADLGKAFGISRKQRKEKPFYCRKCGEAMRHVPGTNVFLCAGKLPDGTECGSRYFSKKIA